MAAAKPLPSYYVLTECLLYDKHTGSLTWKNRPQSHFSDERAWKIWNTKHSGKEAGFRRMKKHRGAVVLSIGDSKYLAHRIIWAIMTGSDIPDGFEIDHEDNDDYNNRWSNLRLATHIQNTQNRRVQSNNKCGLKGVFFAKASTYHRNPWIAIIRHDARNIWLGSFPTKGLAACAYAKASLMYQGSFSTYA